jgi:YebC/PmpR family DNA-binding regulatory protein
MSGHSKWATIKRKKGATDAARGRVFTRLIREITVASRMGGGDPEGNPRLRLAIDRARAANMPLENINRGIQKGTGDLDGQNLEEVTYEGYGPGGCAILLDTITDNKNRTVAEIRHAFSKFNGNLAESNAVAFMFDRKAVIEVESEDKSEDDIMEAALEAGAEDIVADSETEYTITGEPNDLEVVKTSLEELGVEIKSAESTMVPQNYTAIEEKNAKTLMKLLEALDDADDVQKIYSNFDIDDEIMARLEAE